MKLQGSNILSQEQIDLLLSRGLNFVWFPKTLEQVYRTQYRQAAAHEFRFRAPIILILYSLLSFGIFQVLPQSEIKLWLINYAWVGVIITSAWLLSFFKSFDKWFDYYVCLGSTAAVAITFTLINILEGGQNNALLHASMMYAVIIIYGFVGLRFYTALFAGWVGGLIGFTISINSNISIDWTYLNRTYTFSSFLGMALAYFTDRQHRENFLSDCVIELNRLKLVKQAELLETLSQQDSLTGLANRRYLDEVLEKEWRRAVRHSMPITIMMIDLDFFKSYNDTLGHIKGDECLREIAKALTSLTSRSGDLAARYGGEEFLLLFPMTNESEALIQVKRLMNVIRKIDIQHPSSDISSQVTLSVGVATMIPQVDDSISSFVSRADHALYTAKSKGRNQYQIANIHVSVEMNYSSSKA
ncbi:GGDEF domain-containing protein [Acinetobacter sp. UGAL515B_02]|uniref:GGDEF domain-containing protein n=1 Tax=Acinetobacter soli TaxID=487316 RepID=UPI0029532931|nr:GGDEF domain-containing protein [Acinetobacter sp. UGAL515B_02]WON81220.1 GGDEF domain-containing protein [Acinetobacter sp. UGAL515B_02]